MNFPPNGSPDADYEDIKGSFIDKGRTRSVYYVVDSTDYVIKVSTNPQTNKIESEYYNAAFNSGLDNVTGCLGKIISISKTATYLIMEHLSDVGNISASVEIPTEISDVKPENFGIDKAGKIKLRDYDTQNSTNPTGDTRPFVFQTEVVNAMQSDLDFLNDLENE
ncbi:TPA: hypothetical protein I7280_23535 [Vibrio parahaemolyticus]|nr:hypothetical protein [Vibrio parahaemolyticus]